MKWILSSILFGTLFLCSAFADGSRLHSLIAYDAKVSKPLGSVTQVLFAMNPDRMFYVTAAHVYENSNGLAIQTMFGMERLKLEMIDSSIDLAILSSPLRMVAIGALSTPISELRADYPSAYDIQATQGFPTYPLALEGFNPITGDLRRIEFNGAIATTYSRSLPGREGIQNLLMVSGHAVQGYSGGAVVEVIPSLIQGMDRAYLRGIVLAVDSYGEKMVILPFKEIHAAYMRWIRNQEKSSIQTEIKVSGGVKYLDSGAIHYRSGAGKFIDSGAGRTTDGGAGRTTDGSVSSVGLYSSGIALASSPNQRWLAIEDFWSDAEPYPRNKRTLLKSSFHGIYEKDGQLFATSTHTYLPYFFEPITQKCEMQKAMMGKRPINTFVCSWKDDNESVFAVAIPQSNSSWLVYRTRLQRLPGTQALQILAEQGVIKGSSQSLQKAIEGPLSIGAPMQRDGLRTFQLGSTWLHVELTGGYQIRTSGAVVTGPLKSY